MRQLRSPVDRTYAASSANTLEFVPPTNTFKIKARKAPAVLNRKKWGTKEELKFIDRLGTYTRFRYARKSRKELLEGYLEGCKSRDDWDSVDKEIIIKHVKQELQKLGG
jgi:hypothetical protein